jgi:hypothetical protein
MALAMGLPAVAQAALITEWSGDDFAGFAAVPPGDAASGPADTAADRFDRGMSGLGDVMLPPDDPFDGSLTPGLTLFDIEYGQPAGLNSPEVGE